MQLTIFDLEARTWKEPRAAEPKENIREHEQSIDGSHWLPDGTKIPGLCGCCKHGNCFEYEGESHNPIEEPNIYCEHDDGSLNRYCPYEKYKQERFGVGTWHRQHEYDTCERWEKE